MRIELVNKKGDLLHHMELNNNPFKVGEVLNLNVKNHNDKFWNNVKSFMAKYEITEIEHFYDEHYGPSGNHRETHSISITVFEIEYDEL